MSCLASWSEGSARYLVGHLLDGARGGGAAAAAAALLRCFRYESRVGLDGRVTLHMAQSFAGSCMGLWSVDEGARTFRMNKGKDGHPLTHF